MQKLRGVVTVTLLLWVGLGGALGSVLRVLVNYWVPTEFPWATLVVNVVGSFVIGLVMAVAASGSNVHTAARALIAYGFCGAFTTFSAFSYHTMLMLGQGQQGQALLNIGLSIGLTLFAVWLGMRIVEILST